jgi:predicted PurR-regulated permease PerM
MIADGLLGLFVGPVVLAVGYVLLIEWMQQRRAQSAPPTADRTP